MTKLMRPALSASSINALRVPESPRSSMPAKRKRGIVSIVRLHSDFHYIVQVSEDVGILQFELMHRPTRSIMLQPSSGPTAMLILPLRTPATPCPVPKSNHSPCRILSASCLLPKSHMFIRPCSERSMFFIDVMSCAGGLLTREATMTGSVSRMMPSSTSSSTASDCQG